MGDATYRAPVQRSNIHGTGERLSGDVQLGSQCGIQKAFIGPRVNEDPETFGLVSHSRMTGKGVRVREAEKFSIWPTRVLAPTGEPGLLPGKRTQNDQKSCNTDSSLS